MKTAVLNYGYTGALFAAITMVMRILFDISSPNNFSVALMVLAAITLMGFVVGAACGFFIHKGWLPEHQPGDPFPVSNDRLIKLVLISIVIVLSFFSSLYFYSV